MLGAEKCLLPLGKQTILEHILKVLAKHHTILNANGDLTRFSHFAVSPVSDTQSDGAGPMRGIISCLEWLQAKQPQAQWLLTSAGDTPFLPHNYVARFEEKITQGCAKIVYASYRGRSHYLNSAWHYSTLEHLYHQLSLGQRSIKKLLSKVEHQCVDFSEAQQDPFFNINTPEDYLRAKAIYSTYPD